MLQWYVQYKDISNTLLIKTWNMCISLWVSLGVFGCISMHLKYSTDGLDKAEMNSIFPKQLLTASPGYCPSCFYTHPGGSFDKGASYAVGLTGTDISPT